MLTIFGQSQQVCSGPSRREMLLAGGGIRGGVVYGKSDRERRLSAGPARPAG